jgi:hypothetical protein
MADTSNGCDLRKDSARDLPAALLGAGLVLNLCAGLFLSLDAGLNCGLSLSNRGPNTGIAVEIGLGGPGHETVIRRLCGGAAVQVGGGSGAPARKDSKGAAQKIHRWLLI